MPGPDAEYAHPEYAQSVDVEATVSEREWRADAENLGTNQLRQKYRRAFGSFTNLHGRVRAGTATVHDEFRTFRGFFRCMGPRRAARLTLDRTDYNNPQYGPGLCEWADKREQAQNRRSTQFLTHPQTRERKPLVQWADEMGVPASRLRRQLNDHWTEAEIFEGRRSPKAKGVRATADRWPWPLEPEKVRKWETLYLQRRKRATEIGYEFRYEFALRRLREALDADAEWITRTFEQWPGEDGPEDMPDDVAKQWDATIERQSLFQLRLNEALAGEAEWRRGISGTPRPYAKPNDDE